MKTHKLNIIFFITLPFIATIIVGTFVIAVMSTMENKRLMDGTNVILSVPKAVGTFMKNHPTASFLPNDNILDLLSADKLFPEQPLFTPWGGKIQATAFDDRSFRVYTMVPPSTCRKLSLYFGKYDFSDMGLVAMYANPQYTNTWATTFSTTKRETPVKIESACGAGTNTNVAIEFSFKRNSLESTTTTPL